MLLLLAIMAKVFLTDNLLKALLKEARARKVPTIVDPKGTDYQKYAGAHVIKPNLAELCEFVGQGSGLTVDQSG